jgi:hypothetical protein
MSGPVEYRVRWQREGRQRTARIYQSADAAHRKALGIMALERGKEGTRFDAMPDLVYGPVIEVRAVDSWETAKYQPPPPTEGLVERMREWAGGPASGGDGYPGPF